MSLNIIFLDVDGVIFNERTFLAGEAVDDRSSTFDPVAVGLVNKLCIPDVQGVPTQVVISSCWRTVCSRDELAQKLRDSGFKGVLHEDWCTTDAYMRFRGDEINAWLGRHPEVKNYVCLDDDPIFYSDQKWVRVRTPRIGLDEGDIDKASEILFGKKDYWRMRRREAAARKVRNPPGPSCG